MIDIHTHVIPGVDDGAQTLEDSTNILLKAESEGIKTMVATPHINPHSFFRKESFSENKNKFKTQYKLLLDHIKKKKIKVKVLLGGEIYFDPIIKEVLPLHKKILTLNNSDYFLLEFPVNFVPPGVKQFIYDVMTLGFIPILAHPEKNLMFQNDLSLLYQLLSAGALCQIDADSFSAPNNATKKKIAMTLIKKNMAHIISTDCHDAIHRPPVISFLYKVLKKIGREKIDTYINKIPEAIIMNKVPPDIGFIEDPSSKKFFFERFIK